MYDLARLTAADVAACADKVRESGSGAVSMEEVANRIVAHLFQSLGTGSKDAKGCALVRFYKTHAYRNLDPALQAFSRQILGKDPESAEMKCLTLLATAGEDAQWNSRAKSAGHKAIPLPSEDFVNKIPMIARLINQFGVELKAVLKPDPAIIVDLEQKSYNVFHVPEAVGSPYIPAQKDFVIPHGVQSVLGCGGILPSGNLFALILFAKVHISRDTANLFQKLALDIKTAVQPFDEKAVFSTAA